MDVLKGIVNIVRNLKMLDRNGMILGLVDLLRILKRKQLKELMDKDMILQNLWQTCPIEICQKRKKNNLVV